MKNKKRPPRKWTPELIVKTIKKLNQKGLSLNPTKNPLLYEAAVRQFGTYEKALQAAGLSFKKLSIRRVKRWNRDKIIKTIQNLHRKGKCLDSRCIKIRYSSLHAMACYYFPYSWIKAVESAGINYKEIKKSFGWDKLRIIEEIKSFIPRRNRFNPFKTKIYLRPLVVISVAIR